MNDRDRVKLVESVGRLATAENRAAAIVELSAVLGVEAVLFFTTDPELSTMGAVPGFGDSLPDTPWWRTFLATCIERSRHTANLPFPKSGETKSVTGLAWQMKSVLVLVGTPPAEEILGELSLLLPLLASNFSHEQKLAAQAARARDPASTCRAAASEVDDGKGGENTLKSVDDELARAQLELTRARDQAIAASNAKDDFLAALSHELRTPLNPVLLIASEAAENPKLPETVRRDFATIAKNAELEARLIDDLLDLTRITHGKMSLDNRGIDLRPVIEDAIATVRADLNAKKIDFVTVFDPSPHPAFGDAARLQQVFWNILKNAVKFTPAGGEVRIETRLDTAARQIVIGFTDTGIGMTPVEVKRVFDSFTPGDHATPIGANQFGDLGLGMAISQMLVQLHAGTIEAASAGREKGTTFIVKIPLASRSAASFPLPELATEDEPKAEPPAVRVRVLLVEDHSPTSVALARLLTRRLFEVVVAASMAEALSAAETQPFDLVISDIGLPDGDGYSLMTTLKQRHRLRGIAVSGYGMQGDIARSEAAGFIAHLTKPVSVRALEAALDLVRSLPTKGR